MLYTLQADGGLIYLIDIKLMNMHMYLFFPVKRCDIVIGP